MNLMSNSQKLVNMIENILTAILKDTFTLNSLNHRLRILKSYLLKALFGGAKQSVLLQEDLNWLATLGESFYKNFTKDNVYQIFDDLARLQAKLPKLTIYLPFEATDNLCLQIGSYARKTFGKPNIILDTKYDPALVAGCALVWNGIYRDYSLRARVEERKEEILAGFKKYLR